MKLIGINAQHCNISILLVVQLWTKNYFTCKILLTGHHSKSVSLHKLLNQMGTKKSTLLQSICSRKNRQSEDWLRLSSNDYKFSLEEQDFWEAWCKFSQVWSAFFFVNFEKPKVTWLLEMRRISHSNAYDILHGQ